MTRTLRSVVQDVTKKTWFLIALVFTSVLSGNVAEPAARNSAADAEVVRSLLAMPENKIDFAKAKSKIDKLVDPTIDMGVVQKQVDRMVETVKSMAGPNASLIQRLAAVRRFIYVDGDWNEHRPFRYDLSDPLGANLRNKLLPTYVATRRGNCVSMPILFIILADRLGVHVTASTAPSHVFVKYIDDATGKNYNLETTSGGLPARDAWLRQNFPITDEAVRNGVYLRALSRRETVAVMAQLVLEHDLATKHYHALIDTADVILSYFPNDVDAMLSEGTAYAHLIDTEFKQRYHSPNDIPPKLRIVYQTYAAKNQALFDRAEALGWRDVGDEPPNRSR